MKSILVVLAMLVGTTALADDCCSSKASKTKTKECACTPVCYCNPCHCKSATQTKTELKARGKYCSCGATCACDPCECKHEPLAKRVWVEDVYAPGVWYYGYYVAVGDSYEFHYQRKGVRYALSNFNSLVWVNYKHNLRLATRKPVKVVYVP